jgi:tRNA dimethylallyltransferase
VFYSSFFFGRGFRLYGQDLHLMLHRSKVFHKSSTRLLAMTNDRKRMSSHLNTLKGNTKKYAASVGIGQQQYRPLVIVLAGPTAVGKSDVAAELCSTTLATKILNTHRQTYQIECAVESRGHVVSADSVQVYRGVDIGANKPTIEEQEKTPHHLVDIVDPPNHDNAGKDQGDGSVSSKKASSYNAADWMRDTEYVIRKLTLFEDDENGGNQDEANATLDEEFATRRECINTFLDKSLKQDDGVTSRQPVLPVVVGGTMMYLQWLVHGRPDAIRPTDAAVNRAARVIHRFQSDSSNMETTSEQPEAAEELRWTHASEFVASLGPVFASRVAKLCGKDWYRLRRLLEVAYTMAESKIKPPEDNSSNANEEKDVLLNLTDAEVYTGIRSGSLSDAGFDVRCFFLCPAERMQHFHTVDHRCEEMLVRGLLQETAELYRSGGLPEDSQVTRAIGYRQALSYLLRTDAKMNDSDAFLSFVDDFATATRQYAKKQMQWFRKDPEFAFIPVDMQCNKSERVDQAAKYIADMCQMPREQFDEQLNMTCNDNDQLPLSAKTKVGNEKQGKGMKFFISQRKQLVPDSAEMRDVIANADECTQLIQAG